MTRTGVILAAGIGSRLATVSDNALKPIIKVGGVSLLERGLTSLTKAGCGRIVVVVGHRKDEVIASLARYNGALEVVIAENPRFELKNGVSVLAARPHLEGDEVMVAMADHVMGDEVMDIARKWHPPANGVGLLVDSKVMDVFDLEGATKVNARRGNDGLVRVESIGRNLPEFNCIDCGIAVGTMALMDALQKLFDKHGDVALNDGVQALAKRGDVYAVDIGNGFWQDVDTPAMLAHAEAELAKRAR